MKRRIQQGQAAILTVFVLSMIAVLIGISLVKTGFVESVMGRATAGSARAFYIANSGVEEAFYKIQSKDYGFPEEASFELSLEEGKAKVSVSGTKDTRVIKSTGSSGHWIRKIKVEVINTSLKPGFLNAIQAGLGGVELRNQTEVTGKDNTTGNVYSNSFIKGAKNDFTPATGECKNAASKINGSAWAHTNIEKLAQNDSGVCIVEDAWGELLNDCYVNGTPHSPNLLSAQCPTKNSLQDEPSPEILPLPDMGVVILKNYLTSKGKVFSGDCILNGSGGPDDCSEGTGKIGNLIITGDLIKPSNVNFTVSGPVWVKGNVILNSLGKVGLSSEITRISQIFVVSGKIISDSNITYGSNGTAFLLFISEYQTIETNLCDDSAIAISSNSNSVLFYSTLGCITITANSIFHGAILGEAIRVDNNSTIEYDPDLQNAIFGLIKSGGWQTLSFQEE